MQPNGSLTVNRHRIFSEQKNARETYLESVGPAASAGLLELASLGAHVRLDGVVGVQVVDTESALKTVNRTGIRKTDCHKLNEEWRGEGH